jgi:hypothetical protein
MGSDSAVRHGDAGHPPKPNLEMLATLLHPPLVKPQSRLTKKRRVLRHYLLKGLYAVAKVSLLLVGVVHRFSVVVLLLDFIVSSSANSKACPSSAIPLSVFAAFARCNRESVSIRCSKRALRSTRHWATREQLQRERRRRGVGR